MNNAQQLAIPVSIIIAGALIAGALYLSEKKQVAVTPETAQPSESAPIPPISDKDWLLGDPNAPIKIVEYSDPQCGYCKRFHPTMQEVMKEYGVSGKVAWVYRHLPILGPDSYTQALALQCAGVVGGEAAFWDNLHAHFDAGGKVFTPNAAYTACLTDTKEKTALEKASAEAQMLGIQGTPASFILVGEEQVSIDGAQPYPVVKQIIESLLTK